MLNPNHSLEWTQSQVSQEIIDLNIISLSGYEAYTYLLYSLSSSERRNDGRLRDKWLRRYQHIEAGGWWVSGDSEWGQFKPDIPYICGDGKPIKYETPPKANTEIIALRISASIWKKISDRYNIAPPDFEISEQGEALGFWKWVQDGPDIPLIITEGAKKAGALLSAGYAAISLPGIFNGYRSPKDELGFKIGNPALIPQLQAFAQADREIIFCFDQDSKPKTRKNVRTAIANTGKLFEKLGCKVSAITWNYPEKGVDDLIAAHGSSCFDQLYKERQSLSKFNLSSLLDLDKYKPLRIKERYLDENLAPSASAQVIGLKSAKGTGKTEWLKGEVERANSEGRRALIVTHRIQLAIALCDRFGIDHISELKESETRGALGYGLCIDSLHPKSQARFKPEDWEGAILILDEIEQVIWHLLNSPTCQKERVSIIENFRKLLNTIVTSGGKIFVADADLSSISLDYILGLIDSSCNSWLVVNDCVPNQGKRRLINYEGHNPKQLIASLVNKIDQGEKPLIHVSGQKTSSKYGSINLEAYLKQQFPTLSILRIDSESVADPQHPAYGCMGHLNQILSLYDIVIASPVVETGVSIDITNHFDSVWAIAYGIQTVDAVSQTLARLRANVPRHLWIKSTAANNRIGNGSISARGILRSEHRKAKAHIALLLQADIALDDFDSEFSRESLLAWAKRGAVVNAGQIAYKAEIIKKLEQEGYLVEDFDFSSLNASEIDQANEDLKNIRDNNHQEYCQEVANANDINDSELDELKNKRAKIKEERLREKKGNLASLYQVPITPELVEADSKGLYSQLQLQFYLTIGREFLAERDKRSLAGIIESGGGKAFKVDINKRQLSAKVRALELIEIKQFLDPDREFSAKSLAEWFEMVVKHRFEIKTILGVSINPEKDTAIAVAQRLLRKIGVHLEFKHQIRINGLPTRIYQLAPVEPLHQDIMQSWEFSFSGVTPFCNRSNVKVPFNNFVETKTFKKDKGYYSACS